MQSDNKTDTNSNVVEFPVIEHPPMVLACMYCSNQLFYLHQNGEIQCGHCHGILQNIKANLEETDV